MGMEASWRKRQEQLGEVEIQAQRTEKSGGGRAVPIEPQGAMREKWAEGLQPVSPGARQPTLAVRR